MICISLRTVVYPAPRSGPRASCTSRTVLGPRDHSTRRISSSAGVGLGAAIMGGSLVRRPSWSQRKPSYNFLDVASGPPEVGGGQEAGDAPEARRLLEGIGELDQRGLAPGPAH